MSRYNPSATGSAAATQLWNAPISQQQQQQQQLNEQAWRQQQQQQEQEQYYDAQDQYGQQQQQEPVDYDIYNKAVVISSPRLGGVTGDIQIDPQATIKKTVLRRVEVPFTRSVQMPTQVVKLVPARSPRR